MTNQGTVTTTVNLSGMIMLAAGDYLQVKGYQNSGAALNLAPFAGGYAWTRFSLTAIGR